MAKGAGSATTKIMPRNKPPKQGKIKGISTPFHNRIASIGGKR
jgi:hypothetical protein